MQIFSLFINIYVFVKHVKGSSISLPLGCRKASLSMFSTGAVTSKEEDYVLVGGVGVNPSLATAVSFSLTMIYC
jgi:hypothetical protein